MSTPLSNAGQVSLVPELQLPDVVDHIAVARLYGEPLFSVPQDLYIPPDALEVFLEAFEGPLDLLLYLIRKQNFNILDIPMAAVTRQYLEYVDEIRSRNLELAAEYLLMAAMLIEIKSRMLLPPRKTADGEEAEDPRAELVRRLQEYERIKLAVTCTSRGDTVEQRLAQILRELGMRVRYLHSDIKTMERMELLRDLRLGAYDTLVGINLLREGLDLPEVALVAILDADKEGFLRSETSLVQTVGRAARNTEGRVIMYADQPTDSMMRAIGETNRRRSIQEAYNKKHGITPETINSAIRELIAIAEQSDQDAQARGLSPEERAALASAIEDQMLTAAQNLDFEQAAKLRDQLFNLRGEAPIEKKQPQPARRRRARTRK